VIDGRRQVTSDDVWTDRQRELFKLINDKRDDLENGERIRQMRLDELSILIEDILNTGMKKSRVARVFHMPASMVRDLTDRAETARALLEAG